MLQYFCCDRVSGEALVDGAACQKEYVESDGRLSDVLLDTDADPPRIVEEVEALVPVDPEATTNGANPSFRSSGRSDGAPRNITFDYDSAGTASDPLQGMTESRSAEKFISPMRTRSAGQFATLHEEPVHLFLGTMNAGNAQINHLDRWIPREGRMPPELLSRAGPLPRENFDLISIALQESQESQNPYGLEHDSEDEADGDHTPPAVKHVSSTDAQHGEDASIRSPSTVAVGRMKSWSPHVPHVSADSLRRSISLGSHAWDIINRFHAHLGDKYDVLAYEASGQMILMVFVLKILADMVDGVEVLHENTGVAHIGWNKGGQLVKFMWGNTPLCFFSAHLAAHEAQTSRRNHDVCKIFAGCRVMDRTLDATLQAHHTFFMGDLNYRVEAFSSSEQKAPDDVDNPPDATEKKEKEEQKKKRLRIMRQLEGKIASQDWASLLALDQLAAQMATGHVFSGFEAPAPNFAPTFKVERGKAELHYNYKRVPSYTDRVLHRSLPGMRDSLELLAFESCPLVTSSDHKPVRAMYRLVPSGEVPSKSTSTGQAVVELVNLSVSSDRQMKRGSSVWRFFASRLASRSPRHSQEETRQIRVSTLPVELCSDPVLSKDLLLDVNGCNCRETLVLQVEADCLDLVHLIIECRSPEGPRASLLTGAVPVSLKGVLDMPLRLERLPLSRNGQTHGYLSGSVRAYLPGLPCKSSSVSQQMSERISESVGRVSSQSLQGIRQGWTI